MDINGLVDLNQLAFNMPSIGQFEFPSLEGFTFGKTMVMIILLLVLIFWGNETLKKLIRITALITLLAVLFNFIKF